MDGQGRLPPRANRRRWRRRGVRAAVAPRQARRCAPVNVRGTATEVEYLTFRHRFHLFCLPSFPCPGPVFPSVGRLLPLPRRGRSLLLLDVTCRVVSASCNPCTLAPHAQPPPDPELTRERERERLDSARYLHTLARGFPPRPRDTPLHACAVPRLVARALRTRRAGWRRSASR